MAIFHCYVSSPEGNWISWEIPCVAGSSTHKGQQWNSCPFYFNPDRGFPKSPIFLVQAPLFMLLVSSPITSWFLHFFLLKSSFFWWNPDFFWWKSHFSHTSRLPRCKGIVELRVRFFPGGLGGVVEFRRAAAQQDVVVAHRVGLLRFTEMATIEWGKWWSDGFGYGSKLGTP